MGDHMVGRAAAVIAKQLLLGKRVTCVRVDKANIAGSEIRNKIKYLNFLRKRKLTNPTLGPFHKRAPNEVFTRIVRGMLPFYTKPGSSLSAACRSTRVCRRASLARGSATRSRRL